MGETLMYAVAAKLILLLVALAIASYTQLTHAKASYPDTTSAKVKLFLSGFAGGTCMSWLFFPGVSIDGLVVSAIGPGLISGWAAVYWFPIKMRAIMRKSNS